jgi:hypothetical protein
MSSGRNTTFIGITPWGTWNRICRLCGKSTKENQRETPSPVSPRLMKTPRRATLSPKGARAVKPTLPSPLWGRGLGVRGCLQHTVVKYYAERHTRRTAVRRFRGGGTRTGSHREQAAKITTKRVPTRYHFIVFAVLFGTCTLPSVPQNQRDTLADVAC